MDILIKSFNRVYYLDRCLRSVYEHVRGNFTVKILDDGTPPAYLARIQELYPQVQVLRSPQYAAKVAAIAAASEHGAPYTQKKIPTGFWIEAIANSTDYFLLLEDDIWLTGPVDIAAVEQTMRQAHMALLRLSWQGNTALVAGGRRDLDGQSEEIIPQISPWHQFVFTNKFKIRSLGYRLGLFRNIMHYQLPMYVLYAVASAFFSKEYWLYLWQGAGERVLEEYQLKKALKWYHQPQQSLANRYSKLKQESAETSYLTSTNNGYTDVKCDMMQINYLLNQAWLQGELDSLCGWPKDFPIDYLMQFIRPADKYKELRQEWLNWITRFKHDYRTVGCQVD